MERVPFGDLRSHREICCDPGSMMYDTRRRKAEIRSLNLFPPKVTNKIKSFL